MDKSILQSKKEETSKFGIILKKIVTFIGFILMASIITYREEIIIETIKAIQMSAKVSSNILVNGKQNIKQLTIGTTYISKTLWQKSKIYSTNVAKQGIRIVKITNNISKMPIVFLKNTFLLIWRLNHIVAQRRLQRKKKIFRFVIKCSLRFAQYLINKLERPTRSVKNIFIVILRLYHILAKKITKLIFNIAQNIKKLSYQLSKRAANICENLIEKGKPGYNRLKVMSKMCLRWTGSLIIEIEYKMLRILAQVINQIGVVKRAIKLRVTKYLINKLKIEDINAMLLILDEQNEKKEVEKPPNMAEDTKSECNLDMTNNRSSIR